MSDQSPETSAVPAAQTTAELGLNLNHTEETNFVNSLPEDLRAEPSLASIKDVHSLAKGYVSAQKMIGSSVRIPGPDAAPEIKAEFYKKLSSVDNIVKLPDKNNKEELDAFYTKMGRPATPDQYKIQVQTAVPIDSNTVGEFQKFAHQLGLTNDQAQAMVQYDVLRTEQAAKQFEANKGQTVEFLKKEWGNDYQARLETAKEITTHFGAKYPEAVKDLLEGPAGNNPVVLMMASELGKVYRESGIIQGERTLNFGITPEEARARIAEIKGNPNHDYYKTSGRAHDLAVAKVEELYKAAHPDLE